MNWCRKRCLRRACHALEAGVPELARDHSSIYVPGENHYERPACDRAHQRGSSDPGDNLRLRDEWRPAASSELRHENFGQHVMRLMTPSKSLDLINRFRRTARNSKACSRTRSPCSRDSCETLKNQQGHVFYQPFVCRSTNLLGDILRMCSCQAARQ